MREAPSRLRCEYQEDPLGIDVPRPRLSWWLNDGRPAELQTAFQVQAASSAAALQSGSADLWDTGHVSSRQTVNVEYRGRALTPGERVWWRVRCYDSDGTPSPWSEVARFELGPVDAEHWQARWIAAPLTGSRTSAVPAPLLYRDFELPAVPAAARLQMAVLGSAWAELNGRAVSTAEPLGPWFDLGRRVPCRIYDVTGLLVAGRNRIAVVLGDGDYCGHLGGGPRQRYGRRPALCVQLVMESAGGERRTLISDADWCWRPSWVLRADRDGGEEVDGRQFHSGWSRVDQGDPGYAVIEETHAVARIPVRSPPARVLRELEPVMAPQRRRGGDGRVRLRFDFGRSVLGRVRLRLRTAADTVVILKYGLPVPAARPDAQVPEEPTLRWESATDAYTCRGGDDETFEPRFALHAFRFLDVEVDQEPHEPLSVTALEVASGLAPAASLGCDHGLIERLFAAATMTCRQGLALGPVSAWCPDQRCASVADSQAVLGGAAACLDVAALYWDWIGSLADAQQLGNLPARLPQGPIGSDLADTEALLPCLWFLYRCYADHRLLEVHYPSVQRYLQHQRQLWPDLIRGDPAGPLRQQLLSTAGYAYALSLATRMAGVLGRLGDLEAFEALGDRVRRAFRARFLTGDGLLADDDQLGYLLALQLGLLEGQERSGAMGRLEAQLRAANFHPGVDLRHGGLLLEVLTLEGRVDLAYQTLLQTTAPGWLHPLHAGSDLLWDTARDQPGRLALASVAGWLQRFLLGLELDDNLTPEMNAYRRMRIQPRPPLGPEFGAGWPVRRASGHLDTVHGRYECAWQITDEAFELRVQVPGNGSARVVMPDGGETVVMAGTHGFSTPHDVRDGATTMRRPVQDIPVLREYSGGG
ncbi:MAG: family 78 glycoside hydrolase catalytic domain [Pseudomonadales bacterium]